MKITVKKDIESCRECCHCDNDVQRHDDPFTSGPVYNSWYCNYREYSDFIIKDAWTIDERCPFITDRSHSG